MRFPPIRVVIAAIFFTFPLAALAQSSYTCNFTLESINGSSISGVYGLGVNHNDTIVGSYYQGATQYGFRRSSTGVFQKYLYPGSQGTSLNGINDKGAIVGSYTTGSQTGYGLEIGVGGKATQLAYPGATLTSANGMDDLGDIVGYYNAGSTQNGFQLQNGSWTSIQYPGGSTTQALGMNNSGTVVGTYTTFLGLINHGFILKQGQYTSVDYPGAQFTILYGINRQGIAAGLYFGTNNQFGGFLYENGKYLNVTIPNVTSLTTQAINDKGDITGQATVSSGQQEYYLGTNCHTQ